MVGDDRTTSRGVRLYVPSLFFLIAVSGMLVVICDPSFAARIVGIWSLPPRMWNFSFDLPNVRNWPGPA